MENKYILYKINNDTFQLQYVTQQDLQNLQNYIIINNINSKLNINIVKKILKYNIDILNTKANDTLLEISNDMITLLNIDFKTFLQHYNQFNL